MKRKRLGFCALCGHEKELTRDHTPPKCLFPRPQNNPIILHTCRECNNGTASQDEEFGAILNLMANDPGNGNDIHWERSKRTIKNQHKLLRELLAKMRPVLLQSESGIIQGHGALIPWRHERLIPSVEKSVRLLHFKHFGVIVHKQCCLQTFSFDLTRQPVGQEIERRSFLLDLMDHCQQGMASNSNFFHYRWASVIDHPECSIWVLMYMKRIAFLTIISPSDLADN